MKMRTFSAFAAAAVLAAALVVPSAALAQGVGFGPGFGFGAGPAAGYGPGMGYGQGMGYGAGVGFGFGIGTDQQQAITQSLGMTPADLQAARQSGKSVADLAKDKGIDLQQVIDAAMQVRKNTVAASVASGDLTQTQADWLLAEMETQLRAAFSNAWGVGPVTGAFGNFYGIGLLAQAAHTFSMTPRDLIAQLQSGKTISGLAQEQGVDLQKTILDPLVQRERTQLQDRVTSGSMTQADADTTLSWVQLQLQSRAETPGVGPGPFGYGPGTGAAFGMGPGVGYGYGGGYGLGPGYGMGPGFGSR